MTSLTLKEEGNAFFKEGKYEEALAKYTEGLNLYDGKEIDKVVFYKNKAACQLKLEKYSLAASECSKALDLSPNEPKALFRRCQALEKMEKYEEAYRDAMQLLRVDPKNTAIQPLLMRINPIIQKKMQERDSTDCKVSQMLDMTFVPGNAEAEKRKQAANNLIVLAREDSGADKIHKSGGIGNLLLMLDTEKDPELKLIALRVLACLAKNSFKRARCVLDEVDLKKMAFYISMDHNEISTATAHIVQNIINSITDIEGIRKEKEQHEHMRKTQPGLHLRPFAFVKDKISAEALEVVDQIFLGMIQLLNQKKVSAFGRDNIMELIIKYVSRSEGVGWSDKMACNEGIQKLLEVAGTVPEHKILPITENSRMHASLCLSKIYEDLMSDREREEYRDAVNKYFDDMLSDDILESKLESVMALAALLQGPLEVGNMILGRQGILDMIMAMADSGNIIHTKYAVEALVHSASKKDKCSGVIKPATPILKKLYQSSNDNIKVRALVGLCKLGSFGGIDFSAKTFADGSTLTLAKACRKFMCNKSKDIDLRRWAAEGLAYLTLDADVKEELVADDAALNSLIDLGCTAEQGVLYPVAQVFVNCCNGYDKPDIDPEMLELAKFAQHHVPEDHEKDKDPFVSDRRNKLVKAGVVTALVALSKTESDSCRELLARVFLAVSTDADNRGLVVQQGGAKALLPLSITGTDKGKDKASQTLAKIAITTNPAIAFPGQRACEVVRPLLRLLHADKTALENFEALMALTNLASMDDTVRERIVKENGVSLIEYFSFEEHDQLKLASTECLCNMVMNEKVAETYKKDNDRLKLFLLFSSEDDVRLVRAASGGLAFLSHDPDICTKITTCSTQWYDIMERLAACDIPEIQHRGLYVISNMIASSKEVAQRVIEGRLLEILMALSILEDPERQAAQQCATEALGYAVKWELIKPTPQMIKAAEEEKKQNDEES